MQTENWSRSVDFIVFMNRGTRKMRKHALDEDKLDVHQGFVDFVLLKPRENSSLTLRIGRQEMGLRLRPNDRLAGRA